MESTGHLEMKLSKLQNDIELLEKQINLSDAEGKNNSVSGKSERKKNSLEIKQLRMQVKELEINLQMRVQDDKRLIKEALQQTNLRMDERCSAKEMMEQVEHRLLDLNNKFQSLSHRVKFLERNLSESEQLLKEMDEQCRNDNIPTEADCIQHIRDLENENMKFLKNITDGENEQRVMKTIQQRLRKREATYYKILMDIKEGEYNLTNSPEENIPQDQNQNEDNHLDATKREIKKLENDISVLKDLTICHDYKNLDSIFLEQKAMSEDLMQLKKASEKRLKELKEEKRTLASKRASMKKAENFYPNSDIDVLGAQSRLQEQEIRLDSAKREMERLKFVSNRAKEIVYRILSKIKPKAINGEMQNRTLGDLSKQVENLIKLSFPITEHSEK